MADHRAAGPEWTEGVGEFVSVEEHLGHNTQSYYNVLTETGQGRWSPEREASPWIEFILTAHFRQARAVQRRIW